MPGVLPSIIVLGMVALAALHLALRYPSPPGSSRLLEH